MHFASRVLTLLAAIAMLAPVNSKVELKRTSCEIDPDSGACCCESTDCDSMPNPELSCCSGGGDGPNSDQSSTTVPHQNDDGCPCGNCSCRVIICCGHAMPFLVAPIVATGSFTPLINSLPVPNMNVTGDACLQGVFHPPRC